MNIKTAPDSKILKWLYDCQYWLNSNSEESKTRDKVIKFYNVVLKESEFRWPEMSDFMAISWKFLESYNYNPK